MNALVINTYGGSLLLGAKAAKANIIATMEDCGFGSDLQALNFPKVPRYEKRADWPNKFAQPWKYIDVVAHPPCAAFSVINYSNHANTRGTGTSAFACHQEVIDYALGHNCRTLSIESVVPAYEGAHEIYENNAEKYGYRVNYVMVNSASLGVPQWRDRVWVVYHQLSKRSSFCLDYRPKYVTLSSILNTHGTDANLFHGTTAKAWKQVLPLIKPSWPSGRITTVLEKIYDLPKRPRFEAVLAKFPFQRYDAANPRLVRPDDLGPVMMHDTIICEGKRPLTVEEYCAIMGFPRDYKWGKQIKKFRMYLSKGVCPPVATWIMKMVDKNASGWTGPSTHSENDFGGVIDLRVKKQEALALARGEEWPPPGLVKPTTERTRRERSGAVIKARRDPSAPRGHHYRLLDAAKCIAPQSPQAAFILKELKRVGKRGLTRSEVVTLAIKDPKGFPTNQPHDHAVGFFLSKFRVAGGLEFAE